MPLKDLTARKEYKKQQYLKKKLLLKIEEPILEIKIEPNLEIKVEPILEKVVEPEKVFNLKEYKKQQYLKKKLLNNEEPIIVEKVIEPIIKVEKVVEPKAFNLKNFLNETCKNAINKTDFISSLKLEISDLEYVGELGYVKGISSIICRNLKILDEAERPIHCTDEKRKTFYIKNEDKWEKEDDENAGLIKFIKKIAIKNYWLIRKYEILYPDCKQSGSAFADKYNNIIVNSMDEDKKNISQIIQNISNVTLIKKH